MDESKHAPIADVPKFTKDDLPKPRVPAEQAAFVVPISRAQLEDGPIDRGLETPAVPLSTEPSEPVVHSDSDGSPLNVRKHMERMTADAAVLTDAVRRAKVASDEALAVWRRLRDDLEEATRILKAYERIRSPKRRKQP